MTAPLHRTPRRIAGGLPDGRDAILIGYDDLHHAVLRLAADLRARRPDIVLGVLRGGAVPAAMFAQELATPVGFVGYNRRDRITDLRPAGDIAGRRVLLVDDFAGSGESLEDCAGEVRRVGCDVLTCAVHFDNALADQGRAPDFGIATSDYVMSPWDRLDLSPETQAKRWAQENRLHWSDEAERIGTDLDGVLIADIPAKRWRSAERRPILTRIQDEMPAAEAIPPELGPRAHVITGRPLADFERTRAWLDRNGYARLLLHLRPPDRFGFGREGSAAFKADRIRSLGITIYYESDLWQATRIADLCPLTRIVWWGRRTRRRIRVEPV